MTHDEAIQDVIAQTVVLMNAPVPFTQATQIKFQKLLFDLADKFDVTGFADKTSPQFAAAVEMVSSTTFIQATVETRIASMAQALDFPPTLQPVVIAINLIRNILCTNRGHKFEMKTAFECDFDFPEHVECRNGWDAFYIVYGEIVRRA